MVFLPLAATLAIALADEPSPVRLCADAPAGTEVEVCMRLASDHPEAITGIAAALRAHIDRSASRDRVLLRETLLLLSPETAIEGAERLARLGDPRAVDPLLRALRGVEISVARAAVAALGSFPRALEALSESLTDKSLPLAVRMEIPAALGFLELDEGADTLIRALRRKGSPPGLRQRMLEVVRTRFPQRMDEVRDQVTASGRGWIAASGSLVLGSSLGAAAHFARTDLEWLGSLTGAAAGGTAGWVIGSRWSMEARDASFITGSAALGLASGSLIASGAVDRTRRESAAWVGGLAGEATGLATSLLLYRRHPGRVPDAIEATVLAASTGLVAGTLAAFLDPPERLGTPREGLHAPQLATGLGMLAGGVVGHWISPKIQPDRSDAWMMALGTAFGFTAGALVPVGDQRRRTLPLTGAALGLITTYSLSNAVTPDLDTLAGAFLGLGFGGALGGGVGTLASADGNPTGPAALAGALTGGALGLGSAAYLAQRNPLPIDPRDVVLASLVTGWATWQTAGWGEVLDVAPRLKGLYSIIPSVAGISIGLATPGLDVPVPYSFSAASLGLWGGFLGAVTAKALDTETLPAALIGSNIGLGAGILAASPLVEAPPLVIGLADAGGVLGGALGALGSALATDDVDTILVTTVIGAATGFVGGAIAGGALHRSGGGGGDQALHVNPPEGLRWSLAPGSFRVGNQRAHGVVLQVTGW